MNFVEKMYLPLAKKCCAFAAFLCFWWAFPGVLFAQGKAAVSSDSLCVAEVNIFGNRLTKRRIILRELRYKTGTKLPKNKLDSLLALEKSKVLNTNLFSSVEITHKPDSTDAACILLNISVKELWYTWPRPIFEPGDRSLSEWLNNRSGDLRRINYGAALKQRNILGLNQTLKLNAQFGFLRSFSFRYNFPFIDKKQRTSLSVLLRYRDKNTVAYLTGENSKFIEISDPDNTLSVNKSVGVSLGKRRRFYASHHLGVSYQAHKVKDTIAVLNPDFFLEGRKQQRFFRLDYGYSYDRRDFAQYPLAGHYFSFFARRFGLGIFKETNLNRFDFDLAKYFSIGKTLYFATMLSGKASFPTRQPYALSAALGYRNNLIRGLDNFVAEGEHVFVSKNILRYKLIDKEFNISKIFGLTQFNAGNIALFPKIYFDFGYVKNSTPTIKNRPLSNRPIWGTGFGFDLIVLRSLVLRFEYSFSFRGKHGFYLYNIAELQ